MLNKVLLIIIRSLPSIVYYQFSNLLRFTAKDFLSYRKDVIISNLERSFPEESKEEKSRIFKQQYANFADVLVEPMIAYSFKQKHWKKRVELFNIEPIKKYLDEGTAIVLVAGHQANWEWGGFALRSELNYPIEFLYKNVENSALNKFMLRLRSHEDQLGIDKDKSMREFVKRRNEPRILALVSDQMPSMGTEKKWVNFLGQETAFYIGAERTATAFQYPVFYADVVRTKRGYYKVEYTEIASPSYQKDADYAITEQFASMLEKSIQANPESYLWSHRRWKYTKGEEAGELAKLKSTRS